MAIRNNFVGAGIKIAASRFTSRGRRAILT